MNNKIVEQFIDLNSKIKELELEKDVLKLSIMSEMQKEKLFKTESDYGIFTIASRTSWLYTKAVLKLKEELKVKEIKEQQSGKAKGTVSEYLRFTPVKE